MRLLLFLVGSLYYISAAYASEDLITAVYIWRALSKVAPYVKAVILDREYI
jgi:hypothetical protein